MQLPSKVNVHGHWYRVLVVPERKVPEGGIGYCEWPSRLIHVASELSDYEKLVTFLHEVRHAWQFETGFAHQILDEQAMEIDAESFASLALSVLEPKLKESA